MRFSSTFNALVLLLREKSREVVMNYLVGDGGEDAVVVVDTEGGVDVGQRVGSRPEEDAQRDVHVLQVLRARDRRHVLRPGSKKTSFR